MENRYTKKDIARICAVSVSTLDGWIRKLHILPLYALPKTGALVFDEAAKDRLVSFYAKKLARRKAQGSEPHQSLCWTCIRAYGACCWSKEQKPVPEWKAAEMHLNAYPSPTFIVHTCPLYEKELFFTDAAGNKRRLNKVPGAKPDISIEDLILKCRDFV